MRRLNSDESATAHLANWKKGAKVLMQEGRLTVDISPAALREIFSRPELQEELERLLLANGHLDPLLLKAEQFAQQHTNRHSFTSLSKGAVTSFWEWMKDGFGVVSPSQYESRLQVCRACPYLQEEGQHALHEMVKLLSRPSPVCGKCGCMLLKKAKLAGAHCPVEHPDRTGYSRWGDKMEG